MYERHVVFVNVADDPYFRKIGDREQIRRIVERLYARGGGHLLIGHHARYRGVNLNDGAGMLHVGRPDVEMLHRQFR